MPETAERVTALSKEEALHKQVLEVLAGFEGKAEDLIPMLQSSQSILGYLPQSVLLEISSLTGVAPARVFGVATFYAQFRLQPKGDHIVRVCRGTACHVRGSLHICNQLQRRFQILPGETTPDRRFSLETVACFGSCALAPVMVVDESVYGRMNPDKALGVLDEIVTSQADTTTVEALEKPS